MDSQHRRPRLLYITTHGMSAASLMRGQLAMLKERGFDVIVMASPCEELDLVARREGVQTIGIPIEREINPLQDLRTLVRLVREIHRLRPDLVNAGTPKAGMLGMLAAWIARVPVRLYTLRGLRLETTTGWKSQVLRFTERLAAGCAQRVICVSHSIRSVYLQRRLSRPEKCLVLGAGSSNGVNVDRFRLTDERLIQARARRRVLGIPEEAPVIGFSGRLTKDKGITELTAAWQSLRSEFPDLHLLLVGDFETGDPVPEETVRLLRSERQVVLTGFVGDPEVHFPIMDLLAFPSYREGFPNVPLEAAAAERPVVGFAATGTVDAVVHGETGLLVPVGDAEGLAQAIRTYLKDDLLRARHGRAGAERVQQHFRNETVWAALCDLYESLLPADRRPQAASVTATTSTTTTSRPEEQAA